MEAPRRHYREASEAGLWEKGFSPDRGTMVHHTILINIGVIVW